MTQKDVKSVEYPRILAAGDCSIVVEFGNEISDEINERITGFYQGVKSNRIAGVTEAIPTFRSVLLNYDPRIISYKQLVSEVTSRLANVKTHGRGAKRIVEIPVCYGGEYGPDLSFVAEHAGLSEQEVIDIHTSKEYLIYMLGFQPGFPYLGGLDPRLFTPRLTSPRVQIPAGSVGIGGEQTGLYPVASPAGWQIIGTTPVKAYNPYRNPTIPYEAGDYIHFYPITADQFKEIAMIEEENEYVFKIRN